MHNVTLKQLKCTKCAIVCISIVQLQRNVIRIKFDERVLENNFTAGNVFDWQIAIMCPKYKQHNTQI